MSRYKDDKGHAWATYADNGMTGDDEIDIFAYEFGDYHNGPRCKVCGYGFCHHCHDEPEEECPGEPTTNKP